MMAVTTKKTKQFHNTEIPSDWEPTELGKKLDVLTGFAFPSDKFSESGVKLLRGSNVKRNQVDWKNDITRFWPYEKTLQKYELKVDDLVIALDGALIGRSFAKIKEEDLPAYLVQRVARLRGKGVDQSFLHTLFTQRSFEIYVDSVKTHTAIPHISPTDIKKFKVNLPPLPEQKAIAQVLSIADAAIQTTEKLITQKEQRKKWLMQQLLTGKKRMNNGELGMMTDELVKVQFGNFAKIKKGKALTSSELIEGDIPVIAGGQSSPYKHNAFTHENVITISASGAYAGFVSFHHGKIWASDCSVIEGVRGKSSTLYLFYVLQFNQGRIYKLQTGGAQPHVYPNDIHNLLLIIHNSIQEQTAIAQVLQAADKEIRLLKAKAEKLKEQKKGLMQVLLTGKVRLKILEEK